MLLLGSQIWCGGRPFQTSEPTATPPHGPPPRRFGTPDAPVAQTSSEHDPSPRTSRSFRIPSNSPRGVDTTPFKHMSCCEGYPPTPLPEVLVAVMGGGGSASCQGAQDSPRWLQESLRCSKMAPKPNMVQYSCRRTSKRPDKVHKTVPSTLKVPRDPLKRPTSFKHIGKHMMLACSPFRLRSVFNASREPPDGPREAQEGATELPIRPKERPKRIPEWGGTSGPPHFDRWPQDALHQGSQE